MLSKNQLKGQEYNISLWVADVPRGTRPNDLLAPEFWMHCAYLFASGTRGAFHDEITVRADDGSFWGELVVTGADRTWAKVRWKPGHPLTLGEIAPEDETVGEMEVYWGGKFGLWSVRRKGEQEALASKMDTKEKAMAWIEQFRTELA